MALLGAIRHPIDVPKPFSRGCSGGCIVHALTERGIPYRYLRSANVTNKDVKGTVVEFKINGATYYFGGGCLRVSDPRGRRVPGPRIDGATARITRKKHLVKVLLRKHKFSVPEGTVFFRDHQHDAEAWFQSNLPAMPDGICIKPTDGKWGHEVHIGIRDLNSFRAAFAHVGQDYDRILVEETVPGSVYRFNCLGGRVVGVEIGRPPNVEGDGIHTVAELVELKNAERRLNPSHASTRLRLGRREFRFLSGAGLGPNAIPEAGKLVFLSKASNMHQGGEFIDATDVVHHSYIELVEHVMKLLPDLVLCGVDIAISDAGVSVTSDNYHILELNRGPGLSTAHYPWRGQSRDLAGAIIDYLRSIEWVGQDRAPQAPQILRKIAESLGGQAPGVNSPANLKRFAAGTSGDCLLEALAARGLSYHYLSPDQITNTRLKEATIAAFSINGTLYYFDGQSLRVSDSRGLQVPGPTINGEGDSYFVGLPRSQLDGVFARSSFENGNERCDLKSLSRGDPEVDSLQQAWSETTPCLAYQFICLAGRVMAVLLARPANVEGDGVHTISELVELKNAERRLNPAHAATLLRLGHHELSFLSGADLEPNDVPRTGQLVFFSKVSNMRQGGEILDATDTVHHSYIELVERVMKLMPGLVLCSISVAVQNASQQSTRDNFRILELNCTPEFASAHYPWRGQSRDLAGAIIDHLANSLH
jgi:D-alanine-D-alanine ligase-like ATP-grasp enzyme